MIQQIQQQLRTSMVSTLKLERSGGPRVLVVGNYPPDAQHSMKLYADRLVNNAKSNGRDVDMIEPPVIAGLLCKFSIKAMKIAGYVDKYLIFPGILWWKARGYDCIHIADHSNACYRIAAGKRPIIVTCHDLFAVQILLGEIEHQKFGFTGRLLQRRILSDLKHIRHFVCVSSQSAEDLRRITNTDASITVIPNALSPFFKEIDEAEIDLDLTSVGIENKAPFFIHVGGNQFYKNRVGVVDIFGMLANKPEFKDHRLILAGKAPDTKLQAALEASPVRGRIDLCINPSDSVIRALYNRAQALLFISLREGFGWPILEAQACGCLVITTDAEPMRTVSGNAALFVDLNQLNSSVEHILESMESIPTLRENGKANVLSFSEESVFTRYADLYRSVVI